jgi:hypothetical protein
MRVYREYGWQWFGLSAGVQRSALTAGLVDEYDFAIGSIDDLDRSGRLVRKSEGIFTAPCTRCSLCMAFSKSIRFHVVLVATIREDQEFPTKQTSRKPCASHH